MVESRRKPWRRISWGAGLGLAVLVALLAAPARRATPARAHAARVDDALRPLANVLILIGDDHAADTVGAYGDTHGATPRIDALAKQGVTFRRAFCNAPLCTPSRAALMTGRLPHAAGVTRLATPLPATAITLGDWLGDLGVATAAYGKMHFNSDDHHGFVDRLDTSDWERWLKKKTPAIGGRLRGWHPFRDPARDWLNAECRPGGLSKGESEATYFARHAASFFRSRAKGDPFALVVGFHEPHAPFYFPDAWPRRFARDDFVDPEVTPAERLAQPKVFRDLTRDERLGVQAAYYTSISFVDAEVGRVLDALDTSGLADSTIVVYLGDNGYLRGDHGRFEKHCFLQRAIAVPLIIRWPGHLPAGRVVTEMVEGVDLLPTLLDLLGVEEPPDLHGRSVAGLARGLPGETGRRVVFSEYLENEEAMVFDGRYKLVVGNGRRRRKDGYESDEPPPGPYERLYDLEADPGEHVDIAARPDLARTLDHLLSAMYTRLTTTRNRDDQAPAGLSRIEAIRHCLVPRD